MTDKEKVEKIMLDKQLNNAQFSTMVGITAGALSHITSGRSNPSLSILRSIKDAFPDLNPQWLFYDEGPMYRESDADVAAQSDGSSVEPPKSVYQADLFDPPVTMQPQQPQSVPVSRGGISKSDLKEMMRAGAEAINIKEIVEQSVAHTVDHLKQKQRKIVEVKVFFDDGTFETFCTPS